MRRVLIAALVALAPLSGAACGADPAAEGEPVLTVYVSAPLSGPARAPGRALAAGVRRALAEAGGEAAGIEVRARYLDVAGRDESRFDPVTAAANARTASEDSTTIAYIGELDSGASRTSVPITNEAGILQVAAGSGARDLVRGTAGGGAVPEEVQPSGERTFAQLVPTYDPGRSPPPPPGTWRQLGHEAMASVLAAIERADDPLDRAAVVAAYFDGSERRAPFGRYRITPTGELELRR